MTLHIIAGGQFGSEGKGAFTAALVKTYADCLAPTLVRVAGPNAGHSACDASGHKWALRQIPVGAVVNLESPIVLGQQSEIDVPVLESEIEQLEAAGIPIRDRLTVDLHATVITQEDKEREADLQFGSTKKGIGAARASRLMRKATRVVDLCNDFSRQYLSDTVELLRYDLQFGRDVIIEGTQGYGLGLHTHSYPHCTSSNTRCGDFLAMTGLQPWEIDHEVIPWVVFRAHPIRIAGNSGPLPGEITWEEVGQPTEYTTVTKLPRRVGNWDKTAVEEAVEANGGWERVRVAFMFADYLHPELLGKSDQEYLSPEVHRDLLGRFSEPWVRLQFIGTGPDSGIWIP